MTTLGVGIDIVDVARFARALSRYPRLVDRLFTDAERLDARGRPERLAARFAAKEAVLKSLAVGVGSASWRSIEVERAPSGAPSIRLHGTAASLARARHVETMHVSLTHTHVTACAFVLAEGAR